MKLWQLRSLFDDEKDALLLVLQEPKWGAYLAWHKDYAAHVSNRNGEVLDAELPEELCRAAVTLSKKNYYVHANHLWLHRSQVPQGASLMTAFEAFEKFGGAALEEVLEFGSYSLKGS